MTLKDLQKQGGIDTAVPMQLVMRSEHARKDGNDFDLTFFAEGHGTKSFNLPKDEAEKFEVGATYVVPADFETSLDPEARVE